MWKLYVFFKCLWHYSIMLRKDYYARSYLQLDFTPSCPNCSKFFRDYTWRICVDDTVVLYYCLIALDHWSLLLSLVKYNIYFTFYRVVNRDIFTRHLLAIPAGNEQLFNNSFHNKISQTIYCLHRNNTPPLRWLNAKKWSFKRWRVAIEHCTCTLFDIA